MPLRRISAVLAASAVGALSLVPLASTAHAADPKNPNTILGCPDGAASSKKVTIADKNDAVTAEAEFFAYNTPGNEPQHCIEVTPGDTFDPAEAYVEMWVCEDGDYKTCNGRSVATAEKASGEIETGTHCRVVFGIWGTDYPPIKVSEPCADDSDMAQEDEADTAESDSQVTT